MIFFFSFFYVKRLSFTVGRNFTLSSYLAKEKREEFRRYMKILGTL